MVPITKLDIEIFESKKYTDNYLEKYKDKITEDFIHASHWIKILFYCGIKKEEMTNEKYQDLDLLELMEKYHKFISYHRKVKKVAENSDQYNDAIKSDNHMRKTQNVRDKVMDIVNEK